MQIILQISNVLTKHEQFYNNVSLFIMCTYVYKFLHFEIRLKFRLIRIKNNSSWHSK